MFVDQIVKKINYKVLILVLITLLIASLLYWDDFSTKFTLLLATMLLLNVGLLKYLYSKHQLWIVFAVSLLMNCMALFYLGDYILSTGDLRVPNNVYDIFIYDNWVSILLAFFVPPFVCFACSFFFVSPSPALSFFRQFSFSPSNLQKAVFVFYGFIIVAYNILNWSSIGGAFSYFSRILYMSFNFFPLLVGIYNKNLGKYYKFILFAIFFDSAIIIMSGGRYTAFLNLGLFFLGRLISATPLVRKKLLIFGVLLYPVLISLVGILGIIRDQNGRGKASDFVSLDRLSLIFSQTQSSSSATEENEELQKQILLQSKGRNINWINLSVIALTPSKIEFKGSEGLVKEFESIFVISRMKGDFSEASLEESANEQFENNLSTTKAREFGYSVDFFTSVEWGLLADSWSRGGIFSYALYFFIFMLFGVVIESKLLFRKYLEISIFIIVVYISTVYTGLYIRPLYESIRDILLKLAISYIVLSGVSLYYKTNK